MARVRIICVNGKGDLVKMKNEQNKGYLMVLLAGSLWGTIGLFATLLSGFGIGAGPVAFFRLLSATIMLALILLVKGKGGSLFRVSRRGLISCMKSQVSF